MRSRVFPPLDQKLKLRPDHWSGGAARVATRLGLLSKSFDRAGETFADAVGAAISADSLRRVSEGWGQAVAALRAEEAECANEVAHRGEGPELRRVAEVAPLGGQVNVSSDGAMMLVRGEGWKEVKLVAISQVEVLPASAPLDQRPSRREDDPRVALSQHSYQAGLWEAEPFGRYQFAEALRRGWAGWAKSSSVNDAAVWIRRVTATNFPGMPQVVDWSHAADHLWAVANAVCGEQTPAAQQWAEGQLDVLWRGGVAQVVTTLDALDLRRPGYPAEVQEAPQYFRGNQERMRYPEFRVQGYPIGSGSVESAALTVVHQRMKRQGRGWERSNGQAMLAALSELHSDRFDKAWRSIYPRSR